MQTLTADITRDEAEIRTLIEGVNRAHYAKDADGIAAAYAPHALICNLAPPLGHHGIDLREMQAWLDTWDGPIERESRDIEVTVGGDLAVARGYSRLGGTKPAGHPISLWMRATVVLERHRGAWRIVHEHTSVPFYMDGSLRPAFDLEP